MYGLPSPEFYEERDSFKVVFRNSSIMTKEAQGGQVSGQVNQVEKYKKLVLEFCKSPKTTSEIKRYLGIKSRNYIRENVIKPLIESKLLDYTNKNHINASNQKYITLEK